uniref:Uncharacterized protein n=2 Tax=Arundo donax TaxID=35708 RepID=A0A0A9DTN3_ARUDO
MVQMMIFPLRGCSYLIWNGKCAYMLLIAVRLVSFKLEVPTRSEV